MLQVTPPSSPRVTAAMLNLGHAIDHYALLIFASSVGAIAAEWGMDWRELMPYAAGAFLLFGLGAAPAGRLGDLWGRRATMLLFFFGIGASLILIALTHSPRQMAVALTLLGGFAAIYHPVGIPMLLAGTERPGAAIGVNGLVGNLGVAAAAAATGLLVDAAGWRAAFVVPGVVAIVAGIAFALIARETEPPAKRPRTLPAAPRRAVLAAFAALTAIAACSGVIFNTMTNANGELLTERMAAITRDPARIGLALGAIYAAAAFAQLAVGLMIDRFPLKRLYLMVLAGLPPLLALAATLDGWSLWAALLATMLLVFGQIPFIDAVGVRYFDDRVRSRISGLRFAIAFTIAAGAVAGLGPLVESAGFGALLIAMAAVACLALGFVALLPAEPGRAASAPAPAAAE